jgi:hypothetical protein
MSRRMFEFELGYKRRSLVLIIIIYSLHVAPVQNQLPDDGHWHVPLTQDNEVFEIQLAVVLQDWVFDEYATIYFFSLLKSVNKNRITYRKHLRYHLLLNSNSNQKYIDKQNWYIVDLVLNYIGVMNCMLE